MEPNESEDTVAVSKYRHSVGCMIIFYQINISIKRLSGIRRFIIIRTYIWFFIIRLNCINSNKYLFALLYTLFYFLHIWHVSTLISGPNKSYNNILYFRGESFVRKLTVYVYFRIFLWGVWMINRSLFSLFYFQMFMMLTLYLIFMYR